MYLASYLVPSNTCVCTAGHCLEQLFDPSSGTVVTKLIGTVNVTFQCLIVDEDGSQMTTQWNLYNFQGVEGGRSIKSVVPDTILEGNTNPGSVFGSFRNILKFPTFREDFDESLLTCGTPSVGLRIGQYPLRVYRKSMNKIKTGRDNIFLYQGKPLLRNITSPVKILEHDAEETINLEVLPSAHPFPSSFHWTAPPGVAVQNDSRHTFGYPSLTIRDVRREESGEYTLTATNRFLEEPMEVLGTTVGSFTLDVICKRNLVRGREGGRIAV